ncbi:hypothetical protein [Sulfolobus tengchongensis spindle-shaped virus 4]|nr:hypothetical protein [Sulfolobus tengchongensis spindle-shaped virus 4]
MLNSIISSLLCCKSLITASFIIAVFVVLVFSASSFSFKIRLDAHLKLICFKGSFSNILPPINTVVFLD